MEFRISGEGTQFGGGGGGGGGQQPAVLWDDEKDLVSFVPWLRRILSMIIWSLFSFSLIHTGISYHYTALPHTTRWFTACELTHTHTHKHIDWCRHAQWCAHARTCGCNTRQLSFNFFVSFCFRCALLLFLLFDWIVHKINNLFGLLTLVCTLTHLSVTLRQCTLDYAFISSFYTNGKIKKLN